MTFSIKSWFDNRGLSNIGRQKDFLKAFMNLLVEAEATE